MALFMKPNLRYLFSVAYFWWPIIWCYVIWAFQNRMALKYILSLKSILFFALDTTAAFQAYLRRNTGMSWNKDSVLTCLWKNWEYFTLKNWIISKHSDPAFFTESGSSFGFCKILLVFRFDQGIQDKNSSHSLQAYKNATPIYGQYVEMSSKIKL